jgi:hypothetical protein
VSRGFAVLACAALGLAACGGAKHAATPAKPCKAPTKALVRLQADIAALRAAARLPTTNTLQGNHAVNVATDRFLHDVALAPIGNLRRNRLIDHAMGTLAGACEQCFQALEAARPIENIRRGETSC